MSENNFQQEPSVLLLDLGNVLVRLRDLGDLWPDPSLSAKQALALDKKWGQIPAVRDYESGKIQSFSEFFRKVKAPLGWTWSEKQFQSFYQQIIGAPFPNTFSNLKMLREKRKLYLLSNTSPAHWCYVKKQYALHRFFDKVYLSYELGVMKPSAEIYRHVIADFCTSSQNLYFFDDRPENVEAANREGMNAYQISEHHDILGMAKKLQLI